MAYRWTGDKPLPDALSTKPYGFTRLQWVVIYGELIVTTYIGLSASTTNSAYFDSYIGMIAFCIICMPQSILRNVFTTSNTNRQVIKDYI